MNLFITKSQNYTVISTNYPFSFFLVFLRSESSRFRPASTGRRPDLSVQAHPGMHRASNHPSADAHVEEEGLRVASPTDLPSGD